MNSENEEQVPKEFTYYRTHARAFCIVGIEWPAQPGEPVMIVMLQWGKEIAERIDFVLFQKMEQEGKLVKFTPTLLQNVPQ